MIGIDWSHTKGLAIADNKGVRIVESIKHVPKDGDIGIGQEAPTKLIYELMRIGHNVYLIDSKLVKERCEETNSPKMDEIDALMYKWLGEEGKGHLATLDKDRIKLAYTYNRFLKTQKKRVALINMSKGSTRYFGNLLSENDKAIDNLVIGQYKELEKSLLKDLQKLAPPIPTELNIKGLGPRIWVGILVVADPRLFPHQKQYLRYCGLSGMARADYKFSRKARTTYYLFSKSILNTRNEEYRQIYDKAKNEALELHNNNHCGCKSTRAHCHNIGMNRLATILARKIYEGRGFILEGLLVK